MKTLYWTIKVSWPGGPEGMRVGEIGHFNVDSEAWERFYNKPAMLASLWAHRANAERIESNHKFTPVKHVQGARVVDVTEIETQLSNQKNRIANALEYYVKREGNIQRGSVPIVDMLKCVELIRKGEV